MRGEGPGSIVRRERHAGFTLIELMIVITVAGVLAAVAAPSFHDAIVTQRVKTAASDLHISLLFTRSEAIKRSSDVDMNRTGTSWLNGWTVTTVDPSSSATLLLKTNDALNSVSLACDGTCPTKVTFERTGRASSTFEFRVYASDDTNVKMRCVSVSLSGRPRVVVDKDTDTSNGCD